MNDPERIEEGLALTEAVARAMHNEGIAMFLEFNPQSTTPTWEDDDDEVRATMTRMAEAAILAMEAAGPRVGWQDISSAPKNQKLLAAYQNRLGNGRIVTACYHTELPWDEDSDPDDGSEYAPEAWYEESDSHETILTTSGTPTHWMPLPPPPGLGDAG